MSSSNTTRYNAVQSDSNTPVIILPTSSGPQQQPNSNQNATRLIFARLHRVFGIIFLIIGCLEVALEILGYIIPDGYYRSAVGFWTGIFYIIPGALILKAGDAHSTRLLTAGLAMTILGFIILIIGATLSGIELASRSLYEIVQHNELLMAEQNKHEGEYLNLGSFGRLATPSPSEIDSYQPNFVLNKYRAMVDFICCIIGFFLFPIHMGFTCSDICSCCRSPSRRRNEQLTQSAVTSVHVVQHAPAMPQQQATQQFTPMPQPGPFQQQPVQHVSPMPQPPVGQSNQFQASYYPDVPYGSKIQPTAPPSYDTATRSHNV